MHTPQALPPATQGPEKQGQTSLPVHNNSDNNTVLAEGGGGGGHFLRYVPKYAIPK